MPKQENRIIGHEQQIKQLENAIRNDRVAGAYIFSGPAKIGKKLMATQFAKSINCLNDDGWSCGECLSCLKIDSSNHPDLKLLTPDGAKIKISQIRQLQKEVIFQPIEGKRKFQLIDAAERMNLEAANCLLKTLEEPPAGTILILLTENLEAILPTIRSRCQIVIFHSMQISELTKVLIDRFGFNSEKAEEISISSGGAIGKALNLIEESKGDSQSEQSSGFHQLPELLALTDRLEAFRVAENLSQNLEEIDRLIMYYRDLLLLRENAPIELLTHRFHLEQLQMIVEKHSRSGLRSAVKILMETKVLIERNVNATLALEVLVLKLIKLRYDDAGKSRR